MIHYPPKPRLALTLGVSGHRFRRKDTPPGEVEKRPRAFDVAKVEKALDDILGALARAFADVEGEFRSAFDAAAPVFTLISSLAEGADRLAARAALKAKFALDVILPCPTSVYADTFDSEASRAEFDDLIGKSRARLILPLAGRADSPLEARLPRSYEAAGLTMLRQSDLLIAVWDGEPADGLGGTGQIVEEAVRRGAPVVVIDPANGATRLLWTDDQPGDLVGRHADDVTPRRADSSSLAEILRWLIAPPVAPIERIGLEHFFAAPIGAVGARASVVFDGQDLDRSRSNWPRVSAAVAASPSNLAAVRRYADALRAAEHIAGRNSGSYRRLSIVSFGAGVFASIAVALAAIFGEAWIHVVATGIELTIVSCVAVMVFLATLRRWHNQWFEAREAVERLRIVAMPWLLGSWPAGLTPGQTSWPGWYARAMTREQPLFSGALGDLLGEARGILHTLVQEQLAYHERNAERLERLDRVLAGVGIGLLIASIGADLAYIGAAALDMAMGWQGKRVIEPLSLAASIFLPAAATASYGARLFGDFEDLARRSRRTAVRLETVEKRLAGELDLASLRTLAAQTARAMLADLDAWRVAVESRRLSAS